MSGIVAAMKKLDALGLNRGSAGNCSIRTPEGFLITPSGIPSELLTEEMLVSMTVSGTVVKVSGTVPGTVPDTFTDTLQPSSEWRFHHDFYVNRPDVGAVVHTHSPFATTLACLHQDIPPFHYMIAVAGGDTIRCAPYALFGTQELVRSRVQSMHRPQGLPARQPRHDRRGP
jgi:L-fuculose-phosphate aldolase